jgi:hypothetical protein
MNENIIVIFTAVQTVLDEKEIPRECPERKFILIPDKGLHPSQ